MNFWQSIGSGFRGYADFTGRAGRSEFWWWVLFTTLVNAALNTIPLWAAGSTEGAATAGPTLSGFWTVAVLVPTLAVAVRRLRDAGIAWGHALWLFLPFAGVLVLAVLCAQPSRSAAHPAYPASPLAAR
jgi:uncharacterized membrane protein YhaH (DUF805 family)